MKATTVVQAKAAATGGFSDSDEEVDPYKERLKKEAKERDEAEAAPEDSSDEDDDDYNPEADLEAKRRQKEALRAKGILLFP